jgi:CheY-like chemotaxis protein
MLKSVLVIDDAESVCIGSKAILLSSGFAQNVTTYTDAREALKYFSNYFDRKRKGQPVEPAPELILLDLMMPAMGGWLFVEDFMRKYSERLPDTKIVIITSSVDPEDFRKFTEYNHLVLDFLHKPLGEEQVDDLTQHERLSHFFTAG